MHKPAQLPPALLSNVNTLRVHAQVHRLHICMQEGYRIDQIDQVALDFQLRGEELVDLPAGDVVLKGPRDPLGNEAHDLLVFDDPLHEI